MEDLVLSCLESRVEDNRNLYARFLVGPFFKGDALTVATALRRVLLSSVEVIAITALYIQGITHEFSSIVGVRESVLELSLNFQSIVLCYDKRFFQKKDFFDNIQIGYLQVQGPKVVYANDLKLPLGVKVVDPTQYIATISREGVIVLKFTLGKISNSNHSLGQGQHSSFHTSLPTTKQAITQQLLKRNIVKAKTRCSYKKNYAVNPTGQSPDLYCSPSIKGDASYRRYDRSGLCPDATAIALANRRFARKLRVGLGEATTNLGTKGCTSKLRLRRFVRSFASPKVTPSSSMMAMHHTSGMMQSFALLPNRRFGVDVPLQIFDLHGHSKSQRTCKQSKADNKESKLWVCLAQLDYARRAWQKVTHGHHRRFALARRFARAWQNTSGQLFYKTSQLIGEPYYQPLMFKPFVFTYKHKEPNIRARGPDNARTLAVTPLNKAKTVFNVNSYVRPLCKKERFKENGGNFLINNTNFYPQSKKEKAYSKFESKANRRFESKAKLMTNKAGFVVAVPNSTTLLQVQIKDDGLRPTQEDLHGHGKSQRMQKRDDSQYNSSFNKNVNPFSFVENVFQSDICLHNVIPLDSSLSPVLKVNFLVEIDDEVLYLRQKVRERIILEVWTNGSIHPRQALHDATLSLLDIFSTFRSIYQTNEYSSTLLKVPEYNKSLKKN